MSDWAATREVDGVQLKVRVPTRAVSKLTQLAQTAFGLPEPELEDIAKALVWGWDRPDEECNWPNLDKWISCSIERLLGVEDFLGEVAWDFFLRSRANSDQLWERRPDLKDSLERYAANMKKLLDEQESATGRNETPQPTSDS